MEALRADERVRFSGLSRTEAGIYPAENGKRETAWPTGDCITTLFGQRKTANPL